MQKAKQLMSKANWTPFIDPINNVMGRIGVYGGKNRKKNMFFNIFWPFWVMN
jgi:hypothetical protein